jgi:hypothetical protein
MLLFLFNHPEEGKCRGEEGGIENMGDEGGIEKHGRGGRDSKTWERREG